MSTTTKNQLVYDLPIRLFHWMFAGLFIMAFIITKTINDESPVFSYHMLAGFLMGFIVLLRIFWGFIGTKHSRFNSLALHPKDLLSYMLGILSGDKRKWAGHNPASSWSAIIMIALALGLGITGFFMSRGYKESLEDVHELLANGFLVIALMHVAGLVLHMIRHKDGLAFSMINGTKSDVHAEETISSSRPVVGLLFVGLAATFALHLAKNYNSQNRTLNFFGTTLELGENEGKENENESSENKTEQNESHESHENDDDDND